MSYQKDLVVGQEDPLDAWANMDLKELEEFDAGFTSLAFYLPLQVVTFFGLLFYPLLVVFQIKSFSDWWDFVKISFNNIFGVPLIIAQRIYAIGFNGFYILYLVNYTLFAWAWSFAKVYLSWLFALFNLTFGLVYYTAYYTR